MDQAPGRRKDTFYIIPHTHWEGALFKTREAYLATGLPTILRALRLLRAHPGYRFVLDQVCYVKPFLERYPEEEATFRALVAEGRLAIVGGTHVMPDVNMPGGESWVRQVLYGKGYFREKLGVDVTVGWQLDAFGHHAQMPQLLKLAGYRSYWTYRGIPDRGVPSEFVWEGIDGSRIPVFWLPRTDSLIYRCPTSLPEFTRFCQERFGWLDPYARAPERVGLAGNDVARPEEHLPRLVEEFNGQADAPFELRLAVPGDFEAAVAARPAEPSVIEGELNPIFQGSYSSRIELKQRTRELERLLTTAEKLGVLLRLVGASADDDILWQAWESMLFNHTHDLMSGVMTDEVYEDTIRGYDLASRIADEEVEERLRSLVSRIDTRGQGIPLVVLNMLGWPRTDTAIASVGFSESDVADVRLIGPDGQPVPVRIMDAQRHDHGALLQVRIAFVARDVPALGHSVYRLIPLTSPAAPSAAEVPQQDGTIENEYCRVELDPASGAITRLVMQPDSWNVLSGAGNIVAREEDRGDLLELYRPLVGSASTANRDRHPAPQPGQATFSTETPGAPGTFSRGPVVQEFSVAHPFGDRGQFGTSVRLYAGLRRIEIRTKIVNDERYVRYRVLFPTSLPNGQSVHEIPFGAIARPDGLELPAQNWIDYGDGEKGLALLNRGLPGNNVADGTMMLSLLRSTCFVAYGEVERETRSGSGFQLGKELTLEYALVPHQGDWREARIYREGLAFNNPLLARTASVHGGVLPPRWGLLEISHPGVVVSALKMEVGSWRLEVGVRPPPGELSPQSWGGGGAVSSLAAGAAAWASGLEEGQQQSAVLRIYEAEGRAAQGVRIALAAHVVAAEEVNLMEDPGRRLQAEDDTVLLDLGPFEIKTIRLQLEGLWPGNAESRNVVGER